MTSIAIAEPAPSLPAELPDFAFRQPFLNLPTPGFDRYYGGIECCCMGEDGDMMIIGHVGTLRALAVFRARLRSVWDRREADAEMRDLDRARSRVERCWAVRMTRCATYPMCGSLGPIDDGSICHDFHDEGDGRGYNEHLWPDWTPWPDEIAGPSNIERLRCCCRCNFAEADPPRAEVTNRCTTCAEIDDSDDFYLCWPVSADTPNAFPVTVWLA